MWPSKVICLPEWKNKSATKRNDTIITAMNDKKSVLKKRILTLFKNNSFLVLLLIVSIITITFIFHPTVRSFWDGYYRQQQFNQFLKQTVLNDYLDPQEYWEFRERFSPGSFSINPEFIDLFQTYRIVNLNSKGVSEIIYFNSQHSSSIDSISQEYIALDSFKSSVNVDMILFEKDTSIIYTQKNMPNKVYVWFIKPIDEMKKANGFFDYTSSEMELLNNSYWVSQMTLELADVNHY